jgi:branched-subunit amino acid aminotransferase/4-amino-4-deoxychorismate lyase
LSQHLVRLQHSLDGIRLANPHSDAEWTSIVSELIARQPFDDQGVYFQVTRGVAKRDHTFPAGVAATVFMMSNPLVTPTAEQIEKGVAAYCRRQSLAVLGPQDDLSRRQRADALARRGRRRDRDVSRRQPHRGGVERAE